MQFIPVTSDLSDRLPRARSGRNTDANIRNSQYNVQQVNIHRHQKRAYTSDIQ